MIVAEGRALEPTEARLVAMYEHKLQEDVPVGGVAVEVAARTAGKLFWDLDAPVQRITPPHTHVPFAAPLEEAFVPEAPGVVAAVLTLTST
jgi:pyruvate dehydrogenase E1 component beta subunit